jgi:predicted nucleotidyltransferase component of viral defense system
VKRIGDLSDAQRVFLERFSETDLAEAFYLTGGTALSTFYLHHRDSLDLDLFSRQRFDAKAIIRFINSIAEGAVIPHRVHDRYEFTVPLQGAALRVEFVHYDYDPIAASDLRYLGVRVDSLRDILANKLSAIIERTEPKDYVDVFFLLRRPELSLTIGIEDCQKKFGWPVLKHVLQTSFLRAGVLSGLPATQPPVSTDELQTFFRDLVKSLVRAAIAEQSDDSS